MTKKIKKHYDEDNGDTGKFSSGEWKLHIFIEKPSDDYEIDTTRFKPGGDLSEITLGGVKFTATSINTTFIAYSAEFKVVDESLLPKFTNELSDATQYECYDDYFEVSGPGNITVSLDEGDKLPKGLTFDNGKVSGISLESGTFLFVVIAKNENGETPLATGIRVTPSTLTLTEFILEKESDFTVPVEGDAVTFPKDIKVKNTLTSGFEDYLDIKYKWEDTVNNNSYTSDDGDPEVNFTNGAWKFHISVYPPGTNSSFDTTEFETGGAYHTIELGGKEFTCSNAAANCIEYVCEMTPREKVLLKEFNLKKNYNFNKYEAGDEITFPNDIKVNSTDPSGNERYVTLKYEWRNESTEEYYSSDAGNPGVDFTEGTWTFRICASINDKFDGFDTTSFKNGGSLHTINLSGKEFACTKAEENSIQYESDFTVKKKQILKGVTLETSGKFKEPVRNAQITFPDNITLKATDSEDLKDLCTMFYEWHDTENDKFYDDNDPVSGIKFTDGIWTLHICITRPDEGTIDPASFQKGGSHYTINVGGVKFTCVTFNPDYIDYEADFLITNDISHSTLTNISDQIYTGKAINVKPTVKLSGLTLVKDKNYKITYKNNKNVGTATVTITGINDYTGKIVKTFKINPKGKSIKSLTAKKKALYVKWTKQATKMSKSRITGYQIQAATDNKFTKNKKSATVKGYKKTSTTLKKLKAKKKYYVRMRTYMKVSGKTYYSAWSKVKTKKTK